LLLGVVLAGRRRRLLVAGLVLGFVDELGWLLAGVTRHVRHATRPTPSGDADTVQVTIEGVALPGRSCGEHTDVHVGVQRKQEVVEQVRADAPSATWTFEVTTKLDADGNRDFGGPFVHGKRGERFVYLSWGDGAGDSFTMFRRAKLFLADAPDAPSVVARVHLTDAKGMPMCSRLKAPALAWSTGGG
jgi:hypothetical protein